MRIIWRDTLAALWLFLTTKRPSILILYVSIFFPSRCEQGCLIAEGGHASFVCQFQLIEIVFLLNFLDIKQGSPRGCFIRSQVLAVFLVCSFLGCAYRLGLLCTEVFWGSWAPFGVNWVVYASCNCWLIWNPCCLQFWKNHWTTNICMGDQCQRLYAHIESVSMFLW